MKTFAFTLMIALALHLTANAQTMNPKELSAAWDEKHVSRLIPSNMRHGDLKEYLTEVRAMGLKVEEVGRSYKNREIYQLEWGAGPVKVFLWSQMHGDEPTATSAMIDLLAHLQTHPDETWVKKIRESLTIRFVPMLNPDGAEVFQRRNLQGIDINRDAAGLKTPEGRLLKKLRDDWKPAIGFNLHNQGRLTTAGQSTRQAAISFLAVLGDPRGISNPGYEKNKRIIAAMAAALKEFIPGNIGRYDPSYNGLAFGDNFSAWGTHVILIETGGLHGKDEPYLIKMNFVAIATALQVIAEGADANFDGALYDALPLNGSGRLMDVIFRNASIVTDRGAGKVVMGDIGVVKERRRAQFSAPTVIRGIGTLAGNDGLVEYDASDYFVIHRFKKIGIGESGELLFYHKSRKLNWRKRGFVQKERPDAAFSLGGWAVGSELMLAKTIDKPVSGSK